MKGIDSFFVSDGLEDIFDQKTKTTITVNGHECNFISYASKGRIIKFEMQNVNPFEIAEYKEINVSIQFPTGSTKVFNYANHAYKIEQSTFGFIITVGDVNE